jgi:hypothetical protein
LDKTVWSLTSPRVKRISGPEKFWQAPQKDFFNTIDHQQTSVPAFTVFDSGWKATSRLARVTVGR